MLNKKNRIGTTVIALLSFAAIIVGLYVSQHIYSKKQTAMNQFHGTFLDKPREVSPFVLTGIDQKEFNNASLKDKWTIVFFGFTSCGSVCPTTMAELSKMYHLMTKKGVQILPQVVMISIDPERDSLEKLDHYVKAFNPHFYAARGNEEIINKMTHELGIAYAKIALKNTNDAENYDMEHTGTLMLFNPQGQLSAFFTTPHQADWLAEDYQLLLNY